MGNAQDYRARHLAALREPSATEYPLTLIVGAVEAYVRNAENENETGRGKWRDYVLGEYVGAMLDAFVGLLNGPTGRLDAGTLDTWARDMATRIGYDMDRSEYIG